MVTIMWAAVALAWLVWRRGTQSGVWRVVRSVAALVAAAAAVWVVVDVVQTRSDSGEVASEVDNKYPSMVVRTGADPADNITWTYTARLAPTGWCDEMRFVLPDEVSAPGGCGSDLAPGESITWGVLQAGNSAQYARGFVSKDVAKVVLVLQGGEKVEPELIDKPRVFSTLSFDRMFFQPVDIRITITDVITYDSTGAELEHKPGVDVMKM